MSMEQTLKGRVAVVTGAARGIGQAIAVKLAAHGATVVLADLDPATETANLIAGETLVRELDVARLDQWMQLAAVVDATFGRADIVVNNAGIYPFAAIDDVSEALWRKTLAVNLDAHFYSAKAFVPTMRRQCWGRFINISSNSIGTVGLGLSHYMASKMGVIGFVRGLANDVAGFGITVNAVLPALTDTPGLAGVAEEVKAVAWQRQAIKRFAQPEDIAGPVAFLAGDDSGFITGQAIVVDGGLYKIS
jgi:NAD(P)-dependent dehydrogenase (short-subunit alcohol dehydrogenase family)